MGVIWRYKIVLRDYSVSERCVKKEIGIKKPLTNGKAASYGIENRE
ncbi:hypothetical protein VCRA2113O324_40159 [Vibrio crassostreae]|nr:hypothetical protein VCRA2113O322_30164 [Vibrio crassostreae]CAK2113827.1 hypothetical protein VCRA2113O326_40158 [Vibrio crassostreae]CAK2128462.1 hypothetical protein VCRA2113O324_40159 [Vibrio crassostreae]CAK2151863.1 hypothetical protein VCRA2111O320_40158 [Vibrio crassostreae]CAK2489983.1 hypothetical protein VCRA2114E327_40150 [Vibrio crassostreae]